VAAEMFIVFAVSAIWPIYSFIHSFIHYSEHHAETLTEHSHWSRTMAAQSHNAVQ